MPSETGKALRDIFNFTLRTPRDIYVCMYLVGETKYEEVDDIYLGIYSKNPQNGSARPAYFKVSHLQLSLTFALIHIRQFVKFQSPGFLASTWRWNGLTGLGSG